MALAQLSIRNNYSKQPFLMKSSRELRWAQSRTTRWTESWGHLNGFGKPIRHYNTNRIQSLEPSGLEYLYFLQGQGRSWAKTAHVWAINYSSMWTSTHSPTNNEYQSRPFPKLPLTLLVGWGGTNGTGRPCQLESPWHPPLDPAEHPHMALFMDKNITWQKCIMNSVKYSRKRYKTQGTMVYKQLTCTF